MTARPAVVTPAQPAGNRRLLNDAASAAAGLALYLVCSGGLFYYASWFQMSLVAGVLVGLLASSPAAAAVAAGAGLAVGMIVALPAIWTASMSGATLLAACLGALVVGGLAAAGVRWAVARYGARIGTVLFAGAAAVLIANLWVTALAVNDMPYLDGMSLYQRLENPPGPNSRMSDDETYIATQLKMREGLGFYQAYAETWAQNADMKGKRPGAVFGFRPPTAFIVRDLLGGTPQAAIMTLLVLVSAAIALSPLLVQGAARLPLSLLGVGALCSYALFWVTKTFVIYSDAWGASFGLMALASLVHAVRVPPRRGWYAAGVAMAVVAVLCRELMVFLFVAGVLAAAFAAEDRRFRLSAWAAGSAVVAVGIGWHYSAAQPWIDEVRTPVSFWLQGGFDKLVGALTYATSFLAARPWVAGLAVLLGLLGVAYVIKRREGILIALAVVPPLAGFLVFGNPSKSIDGVTSNYWGVIVVPLLYGLAPLAFGFVRGFGRTERVLEPSSAELSRRSRRSDQK